MAASVSSSPTLDIDSEDGARADYPITTFEGCLGDSVVDLAWGAGEPWVFGAVSFSANVYFDKV